MDNFSDDEKHEIQEILEQRKRKGVVEYLVRWKGARVEDTWEPAKTIAADCAQAVQSFLTKSTKAASKTRRSTSRSRKVSRSRSRSSSRSRKSQSSTVVSKRQTRSRSRGRPAKQIEEPAQEKAKQTESSTSNSSGAVERSSRKSVEKKVESQTTMAAESNQRVLRSATREAKKDLDVQRVHNEQRPSHKDDNKPRSAIWKVADYAVIILFVLSLLAALVLFVEKFVDLEDFKRQALPNMTVLKKRLVSAQQSIITVAQDSWLYVVEQIKGSADTVAKEAKKTSAPGA